MSEKDDYIKIRVDKGMSLSDAIEEWGIHLRELDAYKEYDDYAKKKTKKKKKDTKVASSKLRSPKDKKFMGHTGVA